jgi:hypothetical protein
MMMRNVFDRLVAASTVTRSVSEGERSRTRRIQSRTKRTPSLTLRVTALLFRVTVRMLEANLLRDHVKLLLTEAEWEQFKSQVQKAKGVQLTLERYGIWTARRSLTSDEDTDDETRE